MSVRHIGSGILPGPLSLKGMDMTHATLREKMQWQTELGQIKDADRRYIMLRTDVLMGVFSRLAPEARAAALNAFGTAVRESGGQSARAYFQALGGDARELLRTMADYSAELGWGKWSFGTEDEAQLRLTVRNSPFAAGFGSSATPVCHAIAGMLGTVGRLVLQGAVSVEETECAAQGCACCTFLVRPA